MEGVSDVAKFLPKTEDLLKLCSGEKEAGYIFKLSTQLVRAVLDNVESGKTFYSDLGDYEEVIYLIKCLIDKIWERINTGHFSKVSLDIRRIYSAAIYFKDKAVLEECAETLDKAILVGSTETLFKGNSLFVDKLSLLLDSAIGTTESKLPLIKPLEPISVPCDIPILNCPSVEVFKEYFESRQPVLLRNTINHWPALEKWRDLNYLLKIAGNRTVPIEIGSNYTTDDWSQDLIKFKHFLKRQFGEESYSVEYLAQHELFDQIPKLKEDIRTPDYCCLRESDDNAVSVKAWLGPEGTISPLHQDPKHNILCQVFGRKKVILASSEESKFVYPHEGEMLRNTSQINVENIDFDRFPFVSKATFYHLILQEGECLYIPTKWWHFVRSLSKSFSVSFWWD